MYNKNDIRFAGKHDYNKERAQNFADYDGKTFSVNIFKLVLKGSGKELKESKGIVRVYGSPTIQKKIFEVVDEIVRKLDEGTYSDSRKTILVPN